MAYQPKPPVRFFSDGTVESDDIRDLLTVGRVRFTEHRTDDDGPALEYDGVRYTVWESILIVINNIAPNAVAIEKY